MKKKKKKGKEVIRKYRFCLFNEEYIFTYMAGRLFNIEFVTDYETENLVKITARLYGLEQEQIERLQQMNGGVIEIIEVKDEDQKIALWKELYLMQYGEKYKGYISKKSVAEVEFTQELIIYFFSMTIWYAKEKTIGRYTNNYNDIKRRLLEQNTQSSSSKKATNYGANKQSSSNQQVSSQQLGEALFRRAKDS